MLILYFLEDKKMDGFNFIATNMVRASSREDLNRQIKELKYNIEHSNKGMEVAIELSPDVESVKFTGNDFIVFYAKIYLKG